jgi:hypothetical protein
MALRGRWFKSTQAHHSNQVNTLLFSLFPFPRISSTKPICQPFVNLSGNRTPLHPSRSGSSYRPSLSPKKKKECDGDLGWASSTRSRRRGSSVELGCGCNSAMSDDLRQRLFLVSSGEFVQRWERRQKSWQLCCRSRGGVSPTCLH